MAQRGMLNSFVVVTLGCCGWVPNSSWNDHWRLNERLQSSLLNCSRRRMFESKFNIMHFGWRLGARLVLLLVGITHWRPILHNCFQWIKVLGRKRAWSRVVYQCLGCSNIRTFLSVCGAKTSIEVDTRAKLKGQGKPE